MTDEREKGRKEGRGGWEMKESKVKESGRGEERREERGKREQRKENEKEMGRDGNPSEGEEKMREIVERVSFVPFWCV